MEKTIGAICLLYHNAINIYFQNGCNWICQCIEIFVAENRALNT